MNVSKLIYINILIFAFLGGFSIGLKNWLAVILATTSAIYATILMIKVNK